MSVKDIWNHSWNHSTWKITRSDTSPLIPNNSEHNSFSHVFVSWIICSGSKTLHRLPYDEIRCDRSPHRHCDESYIKCNTCLQLEAINFTFRVKTSLKYKFFGENTRHAPSGTSNSWSATRYHGWVRWEVRKYHNLEPLHFFRNSFSDTSWGTSDCLHCSQHKIHSKTCN